LRRKLPLDLAAIAVIVGTLPLLFLPNLPSSLMWWSVFGTALCLLIIKQRWSSFLALFMLSFLWSTAVATDYVALINRYADKSLNITGRVQSVNIGDEINSKLIVTVEQVDGRVLSFHQRWDIVLYWSNNQSVFKAGQTWQFNVVTRAVHGLLNEGVFNRQRWAMAQRQMVTGIIKHATMVDSTNSFRQVFLDKTYQLIESMQHSNILLALAFGERTHISTEEKQLLLYSGIAHLMAISGLHISLAFMFGFLFGRLIQYVFSVRYIEPYFTCFIGWLVAIAYVWLSGANPPALRAGLALSLWLILHYFCYFYSHWKIWLFIIAALLLYEPFIILSDSAWLSCTAVAVLIFWFQWVPLPHQFNKKRWFWVKWIHLQLAMCLLLLPLQLLIFKGVSLSALLCNFLIIPIISFITVPIMLIALPLTEITSVSYYIWLGADYSLRIVFWLLKHLPLIWHDLPHYSLLMTIVIWLLFIIWRLELWRTAYLACSVLVYSLLYFSFYPPVSYQWRLDMLDVGHGLAIVIHNGQQAILYDTGNHWETGSIAEQVIMPFLRWHGLRLEGMIISHDDSDHAGGINALKARYPASWIRSPSESGELPCHKGQVWFWQNLKFEVLWPKERASRALNKDSCVIKVSDGIHSVLLTGDLEKGQELALVRANHLGLKADILQVPHHGSNSSSSGPFLRNVNPAIALNSISRFNPWRLPSTKIKKRYQDMAIKWYSTSQSGQVSILFFKDKFNIYQFREDLSYKWYNQWFGDISDKD